MLKRTDKNVSCSIPSCTSVKIFAPGLVSVNQDFAMVWGDLVFIFATLYLMVLSILCMVIPVYFYIGQCAKIREMENKTPRAC